MSLSARMTTRRPWHAIVAACAALLLAAYGGTARSANERDVAGDRLQSAQASSQRLIATRQQLALVDERISKLSHEEAARLTSFVVGNLLFVLVHELGHAVISQLNLPVLGREEDAADSFATLSMLFIGTELSHTVLRETARGLWLTAHRDKNSDQSAAIYDEHSLDAQRAVQIICLMIGSDPKKSREIATVEKIPPERQETCGYDFEQAADSWESLLKVRSSAGSKSHVFARRSFARKRAADIGVRYSGSEAGPGFRSVLKTARVLETVARFGREALSLPRPITIKAMKCDEPNAYWDDKDREIVVCFELVGEFIDLGLQPPPKD